MIKTIDHAKSSTTTKIVEMLGVSKERWGDATRKAVELAYGSHNHVTGLDILHSTVTINDGEIMEYQINVKLAYATRLSRIDG